MAFGGFMIINLNTLAYESLNTYEDPITLGFINTGISTTYFRLGLSLKTYSYRWKLEKDYSHQLVVL